MYDSNFIQERCGQRNTLPPFRTVEREGALFQHFLHIRLLGNDLVCSVSTQAHESVLANYHKRLERFTKLATSSY